MEMFKSIRIITFILTKTFFPPLLPYMGQTILIFMLLKANRYILLWKNALFTVEI